MEQEHSVAIVVDPTYGEHLDALAERVHVWVCRSPENEARARSIWAANPGPDLDHGVTTFEFNPAAPPSNVVLGILDAVDLHHGEYSHTPPWSRLEVIGAELEPELEEALRALGAAQFIRNPGGFTCTRSLPDAV